MNLLDRTVGWFNPEAGFRRISARRAMDLQSRAYDGAKRDHRTASWVTPGSSANLEIGGGEELVRNRSRDLVRNNGYALQIVETYADSVVGTGIVGAPTGVKGRNAKTIAAGWRAWTENCDFDDDQDLNGLIWAAVKGMAESGAALIRFRRVAFDGKATIAPLKLQVLEPDFIDMMKDGVVAGGYIDRGIEYDAQGRKAAYWLFPSHPGDMASFRLRGMVSERVPADEVIYLYNKLRPGQDRGMPILAPAIMTLQNLRGYFEAELVRKRTAACMVGFITSPDEELKLGVDVEAGKGKGYGPQKQRMEPGMLTRLLPGEEIDFNPPLADAGIDAMAAQYLRETAAAAGLMYEHVSGDFSRINYSSFRAGGHGFRRRMERIQWHVVIHKLCRPIAQRYREAAQAAGLLPVATFGWRWTPPGFISVDPYKDAQADLLNLRMGKVTLSQLVEERGYDYLEFLNQYASDLKEAESAIAKGFMFDGDPRKAKGGDQSATSDAAEKKKTDAADDDAA